MPDAIATLIGAVIGALAAIAGAAVPELLRSRRGELSAARVVFDELWLNYYRLAALRDEGAARHRATGHSPGLELRQSAWEAGRWELARTRRGSLIWAKVQTAEVALEASQYQLARLSSGGESQQTEERWTKACRECLAAIIAALEELRRQYPSLGLQVPAYVATDARQHPPSVAPPTQ